MKAEFQYPYVSIDLNAFDNNINIIRNKFPQSIILLPVKANAYGHGDIIISKEAERLGINYLATARVREGINLRLEGIKLSIINLGVETGFNIKEAIDNKIELSVSDMDNLAEIENISKSNNVVSNIHLKINTGITRLGCNIDEVLSIAEFINKSKYLHLRSIYSHFAMSDTDRDYTNYQIKLFNDTKKQLNERNLTADFYHLYNSGGVMGDYCSKSDYAVRPGISAYGYSPFDNDDNLGLIPVMTFVSKVIHIKKVDKGIGVSYNHTFVSKKPTYLATIPAGYGDGIPRSLSNKLIVRINGKDYKQVGTISMDLMVIEVDETVKIGDEVFLFGNPKLCYHTANDIAKITCTISYEIVTNISHRVKRVEKK